MLWSLEQSNTNTKLGPTACTKFAATISQYRIMLQNARRVENSLRTKINLLHACWSKFYHKNVQQIFINTSFYNTLGKSFFTEAFKMTGRPLTLHFGTWDKFKKTNEPPQKLHHTSIIIAYLQPTVLAEYISCFKKYLFWLVKLDR